MEQSKIKNRDSQILVDVLGDIKNCADEMGMVMTVWDSEGNLLSSPEPNENFCQMLCGATR